MSGGVTTDMVGGHFLALADNDHVAVGNEVRDDDQATAPRHAAELVVIFPRKSGQG